MGCQHVEGHRDAIRSACDNIIFDVIILLPFFFFLFFFFWLLTNGFPSALLDFWPISSRKSRFLWVPDTSIFNTYPHSICNHYNLHFPFVVKTYTQILLISNYYNVMSMLNACGLLRNCWIGRNPHRLKYIGKWIMDLNIELIHV